MVVWGALALAPGLASAATVTGTPATLPNCAAVEAGFDARRNAQVTTFSDGGRLYAYEVNGQKVILPQPPADFEPLTASDAALERYAFPARPPVAEQEALKRWEGTMASYRSTSPPVSCTGAPPARTGIDGEVHHDTVFKNGIWSGFMTMDAANRNHWTTAEADFFQVNGAARKSCQSNAIFSSWVGLGGWNYGGLIQAGTDAYTNGATDIWYEWIAGGFDEIAFFPEMYANPGDYMGFLVQYTVQTETALFQTYDQNTGVFRAVVMPGLPYQFYDGSTGDFIDERPSNALGTPYPLLNFGTNPFYYARVKNAAGNWAWLGEPNHVRVKMYSNENGTGNLLADPGYLESISSFRDTYYHCQ